MYMVVTPTFYRCLCDSGEGLHSRAGFLKVNTKFSFHHEGLVQYFPCAYNSLKRLWGLMPRCVRFKINILARYPLLLEVGHVTLPEGHPACGNKRSDALASATHIERGFFNRTMYSVEDNFSSMAGKQLMKGQSVTTHWNYRVWRGQWQGQQSSINDLINPRSEMSDKCVDPWNIMSFTVQCTKWSQCNKGVQLRISIWDIAIAHIRS